MGFLSCINIGVALGDSWISPEDFVVCNSCQGQPICMAIFFYYIGYYSLELMSWIIVLMGTASERLVTNWQKNIEQLKQVWKLSAN